VQLLVGENRWVEKIGVKNVRAGGSLGLGYDLAPGYHPLSAISSRSRLRS
jgi:hypothetical protein